MQKSCSNKVGLVLLASLRAKRTEARGWAVRREVCGQTRDHEQESQRRMAYWLCGSSCSSEVQSLSMCDRVREQ